MARAGRPGRRAAAGAIALLCLASGMSCRASSLAELLACRDLADSAARLGCFDREAAGLAAVPHAAGSPIPADAAPPAAAMPPPAVVQPPAAMPPPARPAAILDPQQRFGLPEGTVKAQETAAGMRPAEAAKIEAHIARMATAPDGRVVFTLDDAQVWRQLQTEADVLAKPGDAVTISRGWLGSYWLQPKSGRGCKVTRLH